MKKHLNRLTFHFIIGWNNNNQQKTGEWLLPIYIFKCMNLNFADEDDPAGLEMDHTN